MLRTLNQDENGFFPRIPHKEILSLISILQDYPDIGEIEYDDPQRKLHLKVATKAENQDGREEAELKA